MIEILITSSLLILVIIGARALFRGKVKQKLIYAMWLLAALRLLIPVQFGNFDFSILKAAQPVTETVTQISKAPVAGPSREDVYFDTVHGMIKEEQSVFIPEVQEKVDAELEQEQADPFEVYDKYLQSHPDSLTPEAQTKVEENIAATVTAPTFGQIATVVWIVGSVLMAVWFVCVNLRHRKLLRQDRVKLDDAGSPIPVFISPGAASPCLTGLMRPVIYLTPASAATEEAKRHVLAHELTHWRHLDELWSLVRCLCLCIYWFHPLVWVAAWMSRRDCELACDESALEKLGENERIPYGKTLLAVVEQSRSPVHLMQTATSMNETKKQLTERVNLIVKKPKVFLTAAICVILICVIAAGCAFAGTDSSKGTADTTPSTEASPSTDPAGRPYTFTYDIVITSSWGGGDHINPKTAIVRSIDELSAYVQLMANTYGTNAGFHSFEEKVASYSTDFFKDRTLILVPSTSISSTSSRIDSLTQNEEGVVTVDIMDIRMYDTNNIGATVSGYRCCIYFIEVDGTLDNATECEIIHSSRESHCTTPVTYESTVRASWDSTYVSLPEQMQNFKNPYCRSFSTKGALDIWLYANFPQSEQIPKELLSYTDSFFNSKTLVVIFRHKGYIGAEYSVKSVMSNSFGDLKVTIEDLDPPGQAHPAALENHLILVEIDQKMSGNTMCFVDFIENPDAGSNEPTEPPTDPTEPPTDPTAPEIRNTRFLVNYDAQYPDKIYTDSGVDVTKCESGNLYSCDRETGEIIWLYKADEIARYVEDSQQIDHQWFCSDYIYYVKKDDRSKVFRMDYLGTVKDELVCEFKSVGDLLFTSMEFGHDMVAVQIGFKFVVFDVLENKVVVEHEDPNMDSLCDFIYDWKKEQLVVVYNTYYPNAPDGATDGREYYNVTTGELADTYIW